jgi:hypothetical protein
MTGGPLVRALAVLLVVTTGLAGPAPGAHAASHREAPLISLDPTADITDVYAFRSWENDAKAVFVMNVIPQQAPASGPNFFNLDDRVRYTFHLDLDQDGDADDLEIVFRFRTEIRDSSAAGGLDFTDVPISYAGGAPLAPVTALDGPGSEGLGLRQTYAVELHGKGRGRDLARMLGRRDRAADGRPLVAVPSNVGPMTMPDYPALAAQGVYDLGAGVRVFVGQREETFYIDLGATFDTLNFRRTPILTLAEDLDDTRNAFGIDDGFEGLNVTTIAIEIPRSLLAPAVGMYASTRRVTRVARMGNPLVNEVLIGTGTKDRWNREDPRGDERFLDFYRTPRLAAILNARFGTAIPTTGRDDIATVLGSYFAPVFSGSPGRFADLLRVNLDIPPTPPAGQRRLTVLSSVTHPTFGCASVFDPGSIRDAAGFPNGRRPNDDVTDIAFRVVAGVLLGPVPCLGDGVNVNRVRPGTPDVVPGTNVATVFPFLPVPNPGRSPASPLQMGPNEPLFR